MRLFRGRRGERRDYYMGAGRYREHAAKACAYERMKEFDKAAEAWVDASRLIDWRNQAKAEALQEYVNNRIRFCQFFGQRLQKMAQRLQNMEQEAA